jgi:phosphatidate cytidylyltransferase
MLGQRILTAVVLLALVLPAVWFGGVVFAALTLAFIAAAGWEWARLNGQGAGVAAATAAVVVAAGSAAWGLGWAQRTPTIGWWLIGALWAVGGTLVLAAGPAAWPRVPRAARLVLGTALLAAGWLALQQARALGLNFLLSVFCLVWVADIAAYFGGRAFGRRKLAPSISPGKSWAGVYTGLAAVALLALAWCWAEGRAGAVGEGASLYGRLDRQLGVTGLLLVSLFLAAMSVVGDLFESLVKRAAGAKDSGRLLPGHGGVLDRIDALLPVFPLALAAAALR